ncbi:MULTISPECIES: nicotinate-nucleotide--dimethylbenzimidazole phosphoribosyltransferase [Bacillus]|uniref:nicotinate-nucleotide--dimethylbenzimidazole phosphoribosyltransferase n=1 Tax=Bacillus TaxID=1386 RepID=UPI000315253D|nr:MULTISPECIES: nicotinate-nucleotide--dimethylbenzimidazole phosphoribosyltransferase [Bacillus]
MSEKLQSVIKEINEVNHHMGEIALQHINNLTKPIGSLGDIEKVAIQLTEITGEKMPTVYPPGVIVFAADHGIAEEKVSAYPQEVTAQMVMNFLNGGAAINVFTKNVNGLIEIVDVGVKSDLYADGLCIEKVAYGTKNFAKGPAMTKEEAIRSIEVGIKRAENIINRGAKLLIVGEMGIANTTSSSAIVAAITGLNVRSLVGQGTGLLSSALDYKAEVIDDALKLLQPNADDALDLLQKVGGFEIGAMVGAMLYAASRKIPILLDGFICTASALLAVKLCPLVKDYMIAGHHSVEPGHTAALEKLGKKPLLSLQMRLGEGSGAVLAYSLVEAATKMVSEMATFEDANVSKESSRS